MLRAAGMAEEPNEAEGMGGGDADAPDVQSGTSPDRERDAASAPPPARSSSSVDVSQDSDVDVTAELSEEDHTVPAPGVIPGASQLPPAPIETIEAIAAAVGRL